MSINFHTDEIDFLMFQYYEGLLSESESKELLEHITQNPELKEQFDAWSNTKLEPDGLPKTSLDETLLKEEPPLTPNHSKLKFALVILFFIGTGVFLWQSLSNKKTETKKLMIKVEKQIQITPQKQQQKDTSSPAVTTKPALPSKDLNSKVPPNKKKGSTVQTPLSLTKVTVSNTVNTSIDSTTNVISSVQTSVSIKQIDSVKLQPKVLIKKIQKKETSDSTKKTITGGDN